MGLSPFLGKINGRFELVARRPSKNSKKIFRKFWENPMVMINFDGLAAQYFLKNFSRKYFSKNCDSNYFPKNFLKKFSKKIF